MQRRATSYARHAARTALSIALLGALGTTACTSSSSTADEEDAAPGPSASTSAPPGKYRTLPEPCGAVPLGTLKEMLPGADDEDEEPEATSSPYEGEARVTYDTDRRVGCRWKSEDTLGSHRLSVDFERVVSYDPAVSDDEQAATLFERRANAADIPPPRDESEDSEEAPDPEDSGSPSSESPGGGGKTPESAGSSPQDSDPPAGEKESDEKGSPSEESPDEATEDAEEEDGETLAPRHLDDLGDTAYVDDALETGDASVHRDITLVFRTANVIATVKYTRWSTEDTRAPDSRELQDRAMSLADQLTGTLKED